MGDTSKQSPKNNAAETIRFWPRHQSTSHPNRINGFRTVRAGRVLAQIGPSKGSQQVQIRGLQPFERILVIPFRRELTHEAA